jgi:CBS-domain-containing membrane protein
MRASDIMSSPVFGVTADAGIEEAAALMLERGFTTLPVITGDDKLLGVVTETDLVGARFVPGARGETTPEDGTITGLVPRSVRQLVHTAPPVPATAELTDVIAMMVDSGRRCVPVVADGNRLVGMISWRDVLAQLLPHA